MERGKGFLGRLFKKERPERSPASAFEPDRPPLTGGKREAALQRIDEALSRQHPNFRQIVEDFMQLGGVRSIPREKSEYSFPINTGEVSFAFETHDNFYNPEWKINVWNNNEEISEEVYPDHGIYKYEAMIGLKNEETASTTFASGVLGEESKLFIGKIAKYEKLLLEEDVRDFMKRTLTVLKTAELAPNK